MGVASLLNNRPFPNAHNPGKARQSKSSLTGMLYYQIGQFSQLASSHTLCDCSEGGDTDLWRHNLRAVHCSEKSESCFILYLFMSEHRRLNSVLSVWKIDETSVCTT